MLLEIRNLSKKYGEKLVVDNVSFTVEKGSLSCLLGPSGCGKTTILNMIGGFEKPSSGEILLEGEDISSINPESRNISTVFQSYGLFYHMNVFQNISYGLKFKKLSKEAIKEKTSAIIKDVGLEGHEKKMMPELSGGQRQRVALARSLVIEPSLLLLDEPLSNLDAKLRIQMRALIKKIQKSHNMTMVFVTHDQNEAFEIADQVILMNQGRIVQIDSPSNIYNRPKDPFTLDFIGDKNILEKGFVRPENIRIVEKSDFEAKIKDIIFQGSTIVLHLDSPEGKLELLELNRNFDRKIGDLVYLEFEKESI